MTITMFEAMAVAVAMFVAMELPIVVAAMA